MSVRSTARSVRAMLRIGFLDAIAYRGETIVWMLSTTMPLVMFLLWSAAADGKPIGRYGAGELHAYFLAAFVVRQLGGSWAAWQINMEVRDGTLGMRLLRPVNPIVHYAIEQAAHVPVRAFFSMPVAFVFFALDPLIHAPKEPLLLVLFPISVLGAWALSFLMNVIVGALAFFIEQSVKLMDVYTALFFVFSGYMVPLDLFPEPVRVVLDYLPFRYQMGLSVELLTGALSPAVALRLVAQQWVMVALVTLVAHLVFRRGVRHFEAYGG